MNAVETSVRCRLCESTHPELRSIDCRFDGGELTLDGIVSSFYLKQVAQTLVRQVDRVERVVNKIRVGVESKAM